MKGRGLPKIASTRVVLDIDGYLPERRKALLKAAGEFPGLKVSLGTRKEPGISRRCPVVVIERDRPMMLEPFWDRVDQHARAGRRR